MYPFSISFCEHVCLPLKFLMTKRLRKIEKILYQYEYIMILKIFTDIDLCSMYEYEYFEMNNI